MSHTDQLGSIDYAAETTFGENTSAFATFGMPHVGLVDTGGLIHDKIPSDIVAQYLNEQFNDIPGVMDGEFEIALRLTGHGSTMVGSPAIEQVETFLGTLFGNVDVPVASTTLTGGTATVPTTTASGTFSAGSICRIGALNDARGNGQMYPISTHVTTSLTLLAAMDGAPSNGDVLYPATVFYGPEGVHPANGITGTRFLLQRLNQRYECHGCWPKRFQFQGLGPGKDPMLRVTMGTAWWKPVAGSFPSANTKDVFESNPNAAGSCFLNTVGTATRAAGVSLLSCRDFELDYQLDCIPIPGPGGVNQFQDKIQARRRRSTIDVKMVLDAEAATASPVYEAEWQAGTRKHLMYTGNPVDGKAWGVYLPNLKYFGRKPVQMSHEGMDRIRLTFRAGTGPTTTSERTLSAARFAFA